MDQVDLEADGFNDGNNWLLHFVYSFTITSRSIQQKQDALKPKLSLCLYSYVFNVNGPIIPFTWVIPLTSSLHAHVIFHMPTCPTYSCHINRPHSYFFRF